MHEIESCGGCIYRKLLFDKLDSAEHKIIDGARTELSYDKGEVLRKEGQ